MGCGPLGKPAAVGMKDQETRQVVARVIERSDKETVQSLVDDYTDRDVTLCTDDATAYKSSRRPHQSVQHSAAEYVRYLEGVVSHTNGVESFRSMLKRAHTGVCHRLSSKHLQAYVNTFGPEQDIHEYCTVSQLRPLTPSSRGIVSHRTLGDGVLKRYYKEDVILLGCGVSPSAFVRL